MTRVSGKSPANGAADTREQAEKAARRAQARSEGAKTGDFIEFRGERFWLKDGPMPGAAQMILTHMAAQDPRVRDPDAEDGVWQILRGCLRRPSGIKPGEEGFDVEKWDPGEFKRFMNYALDVDASIEEIMEEALQPLVEIMSARPTTPRPGSSPGRPEITASSTETSSAGPDAG